uniref:Uncharacterized protein n=1 Tax=Parastrongyloides trichosuri TaxID=131310 RepID=A0A0N5A5R2_PARTI
MRRRGPKRRRLKSAAGRFRRWATPGRGLRSGGQARRSSFRPVHRGEARRSRWPESDPLRRRPGGGASWPSSLWRWPTPRDWRRRGRSVRDAGSPRQSRAVRTAPSPAPQGARSVRPGGAGRT